MNTGKLVHVKYEKATDLGSGSKGESTERYIVPTFVPQPNIKAIDVTDFTVEEREEIAALYTEYTQYYKQVAKTLFSFEDWLEHSKQRYLEPKWRTFRMENVKVID